MNNDLTQPPRQQIIDPAYPPTQQVIDPTRPPTQQIYVISVGPGSREYVTKAALNTIKICDIIIGMDYQVEAVDITVNRRREDLQEVFIESNINSILDLIAANTGKKIGVLVTGDAGIFSLSRKIIERFGRESVMEIVPGVSSIQSAFAKIKETWHNVRIYSFHGRDIIGIKDILTAERVAILCGSDHPAREILSRLADEGLFQSNRIIYVCQNLTFDDERIMLIKDESNITNIQSGRREIIIFFDDTH